MTNLEINGNFTDLTIKIDGTIIYDLIEPTPIPTPTPIPPTPEPTPRPTPTPVPADARPILVSITPQKAKIGIDTEIILTGKNFTPTAYPNFYDVSGNFIDHGVYISGTPTEIKVHRLFTKIGTMKVRVNNRNQLKSELALPIVVTANENPTPTPVPGPTPIPTPIPPTGSGESVYLGGDVEPTKLDPELVKDYNAARLLNPTSSIGAVVMMGDMTKDSGTMAKTVEALNASSLKDDPTFFVIGNHEYNSRSSSYPVIQAKKGTKYPLNYFPGDPSKNTYTFVMGKIKVAILNIYSVSSGGAVSPAMFDWLAAEMAAFTGYKIVCCHDPMYPLKKHVGNSLDADPVMRDNLQAMFIANKVNAFFGGHTHYSSVYCRDINGNETQDYSKGVFHVITGVIGPGTSQGEDTFASLNYVFVDQAGNLRLVRKQDSGNSWKNPKIITHTIGTP